MSDFGNLEAMESLSEGGIDDMGVMEDVHEDDFFFYDPRLLGYDGEGNALYMVGGDMDNPVLMEVQEAGYETDSTDIATNEYTTTDDGYATDSILN